MFGLDKRNVPFAVQTRIMIANKTIRFGGHNRTNNLNWPPSFGAEANPLNAARAGKHLKEFFNKHTSFTGKNDLKPKRFG